MTSVRKTTSVLSLRCVARARNLSMILSSRRQVSSDCQRSISLIFPGTTRPGSRRSFSRVVQANVSISESSMLAAKSSRSSTRTACSRRCRIACSSCEAGWAPDSSCASGSGAEIRDETVDTEDVVGPDTLGVLGGRAGFSLPDSFSRKPRNVETPAILFGDSR